VLDVGGKTIWLDPRDKYDTTAVIPVGMWGKEGGGGGETRSRRDDKRPTNSTHEALCPTQMYQIAKGQPPRQVNTLFLGLRGMRLSKCFPEQSDTSKHQIRPGVGLSDAISAGGNHEIELME
jgi:hypothetical protein